MELRKLSLLKFRNYEQEIAYFSSDLNCIKGVNGSGKSNLLEAIHLLSTGKSFRTHRLPELICHESKEFTLEAEFFKDGITNTLKITFSRDGSRKILHNQTSHASFLPLFGILPSIFLSPEDISIINGSPAERRRFLDLHCAQIDPLYIHHLGRYQRALKQRNILLKAGEEKGLFPWEQLMAISASYLIEKRIETLHALEGPSKRLVFELSKQKEPFSLSYQSSLSLPSNFKDSSFYAKQWEEARKKELYMGSTLIGPHRDDVLFSIEGKEVKTYCSEGQKRCCLAALRLSEWKRLASLLESPPIFGIDDFGIHLDEERSSILKDQLKKMGQVFLTAPSFPFQEEAHFLHAENGSLLGNKEINRQPSHFDFSNSEA